MGELVCHLPRFSLSERTASSPMGTELSRWAASAHEGWSCSVDECWSWQRGSIFLYTYITIIANGSEKVHVLSLPPTTTTPVTSAAKVSNGAAEE